MFLKVFLLNILPWPLNQRKSIKVISFMSTTMAMCHLLHSALCPFLPLQSGCNEEKKESLHAFGQLSRLQIAPPPPRTELIFINATPVARRRPTCSTWHVQLPCSPDLSDPEPLSGNYFRTPHPSHLPSHPTITPHPHPHPHNVCHWLFPKVQTKWLYLAIVPTARKGELGVTQEFAGSSLGVLRAGGGQFINWNVSAARGTEQQASLK